MKKYLIIQIFACLYGSMYAEGTKEIRPAKNNISNLYLTNTNTYTDFALYGAPPEHQLKIRIKDITETVYYGLNNKVGNGTSNFLTGVEYRIVAPSGNIVRTAIMPSLGEEGNISTWENAVAGPSELGNANGYDALTFQPTETGDYVIEFDVPNTMNIHLFDITVADVNDIPLTGRLHSQGWQITTEGFENPFMGKMYPYEPKGTVYEVDFNQMKPYVFIINFNSTGTSSTGDFVADRASKEGKFTYPEFEVFINPPDEELYPSIKYDIEFSAEVSQVDCQNVEMCLTFETNVKGYIEGFIDINGNDVYDEDIGEVYIAEFMEQPGEKCISWNGQDSEGNSINTNQVKLVSSFGFGVTHLPLYDVEHSREGYIVKTIKPDGAAHPLLFWDDDLLTMGSTLGDDLVNLTGCASTQKGTGKGCHLWEDRGAIVSNNNGTQETINTWWYTEISYDTVVFEIATPNNVQLSYDTDSLIQNDSTVCSGDIIDLFVYNDQQAHFDTTKYDYEWYIKEDYQASNVNIQELLFNAPTTVWVKAIDKNNPLCISYDSLYIDITTPPVLSANLQDETCDDLGTIKLNVLGGPPNTTINWASFPDDHSANLSNVEAGEYVVTVLDSAYSELCVSTATFEIEDVHQIAIEELNITPTDCFKTEGSATVVMEDTNYTYFYNWNATTYSEGENTKGDLSVGSYHVEIKELSGDCTVDTNFVLEKISSNYDLSFEDELCDQEDGEIKVSGVGEGMSIVWSDGSTDFARSNLTEGNYSFTLTNPNTPSCKVQQTVMISNTPSVAEADFNYESTNKYAIENYNDIIQFENLSENYESLSWSFGDGQTSQDESPLHYYAKGIDQVMVNLIVTDTNGCQDEIIKPIQFEEKEECGVALPTAFSPNEDAINDDIGVLGVADEIDLKIFNRWGEVIFRTFEIEDRWQGDYRAIESPIGVYPYTLTYTCPDASGKLIKQQLVGQITLVR